ncbi:uncharacterized protein [Dysidea avara]|uniref:uncharacterized protein n=1 Tax=Dysidea avara TaxID=196820 RepID=UPI0033209DC4
MFFTTFYQQLTAATLSGTVNELSAFKNLFCLVCPYFTDHARIANKILFQLYLVITRFLDLVISVSDASCGLRNTLAQQSHTKWLFYVWLDSLITPGCETWSYQTCLRCTWIVGLSFKRLLQTSCGT